jgi:aspartyl-tRNA(Asn)/glutamyl-tRNA(Gln) amidotransferase subunit C
MKLSREQVRHVANLARLGLSDEQMDAIAPQLSSILEYVNKVSELDTEAIPPTAQVGDAGEVMRDDEIGECLTVDEALANAPSREGNFFRVAAMQE